MTLLVPFDGSDLSRASLERAGEFATVRDERIVVITIVPDDETFALERGWIGRDEQLDFESVCAEFEARVREIDESVTFRCERPAATDALEATTIDDITRTIRTAAEELDVSIVFIGSENAGLISSADDSVGSPISEDPRYDVHIVRHAD